MENIKDFKKVHYYGSNGIELTKEELKKIGIKSDSYKSLEDCAYQASYDISNDWAKETPNWEDVREGYRRGVEDGIKYAERILTDLFKKNTKGTGL